MKKTQICSLLCCAIMLLQTQLAFGRVVDGNKIMDQRMSENLCALTFDDGPSRNTAALLDMLADYGIRASFFLLGKMVEINPDMAKRIQAEGHEIGSHSWSHPNLRLLSTEKQHEELKSTDELLRSHGITPLYIRPPYGSFDERTVQIANDLGVDVILWSLDSRDWKSLPPDYAKLRSTRGTIYDDGALRGIFLFHDTHKTTVEDLPRIIANLKAGGCERFVTVSEYLQGIADPEPALLMTRHEAKAKSALAEAKAPLASPGKLEVRPTPPAYAAGSGPVPLARCSRPWHYSGHDQQRLELDDALASAPGSTQAKAESNIN